MTRNHRTKSGRTLSDREIERISVEVATTDYDVEALRRRGRPALGLEPSTVVHVRLDGELDRSLRDRADSDATTPSDVIRRALRQYLSTS